MIYYTVQFTYPNGNTEEMYERYQNLNDAISFGENMLGQVGFNARYHEGNRDLFGDEEQISPYFVVVKYDGNNRSIVYESQK